MHNKTLCKHTQGFKYACNYQTAGFARPVINLVFFCPLCLRVKVEKIKNVDKNLNLSK